MDASADLFGLITTKAKLNFYTQQLQIWSEKYAGNAEKLHKMQSYEEKWESKYDDVEHATKKITCKGQLVVDENCNIQSGWSAEKYANLMVHQFDEEDLNVLTQLDMDYDTIKTTLEAQVEMLKAQKESQTTNTSEACQDTGLLG